jgi:arsenite/tail-anchored protein-transporting ATPase
MRAALAGTLSSRFVFVTGKGGVGKTTTAAALAVHLSDGGHRTHLLSTDPAHSLGDALGQPVDAGVPTPVPCTAPLTVEELDAAAHARRWFAGVREAVADLVDRGTYLERDDVALFLDHSLPGMDEVMAALRIAALCNDDAYDRIVIDTAPTGHTLRMLRCGETLQGWLTALDAMAGKAAAVGVALTGRRIRLAGEAVMDELAADVCRFEDAIRTRSDFVVVTREGSVVSAETGRLVEALGGRGLPVRALVAVGGMDGRPGDAAEVSGPAGRPAVPTFAVPFRPDLVGCEGLRSWGLPAAAPSPVDHGPGPAGPCAETVDALAAREIVFFAGKGGVGKSTCAAAFALTVAGRRDVLLVSLDPAGSLGDVFGREVGQDGAPIAPGLHARQLDADRELARFRARYHERLREVFQRLGLHGSVPLDRHVLESLLEMAPPGLDEVFALDSILDGPGDYDLLVLDTAPTGHFLRLLEMPATALSWTRSVLRILLRYRAVLGLDDFASDLLGFAKRLRALMERLTDRARTAVVIVTLAATLPRLETARLLRALQAAGTAVGAVIENRWSSSTPAAESPHAPLAGAPSAIRAPLQIPSPVGADRLLAFAGAWSCP